MPYFDCQATELRIVARAIEAPDRDAAARRFVDATGLRPVRVDRVRIVGWCLVCRGPVFEDDTARRLTAEGHYCGRDSGYSHQPAAGDGP